MRANRLLSALLQLRENGRLSGRELATNLRISERTVQRDMESLSGAGVPVRWSEGAWVLEEEWRKHGAEAVIHRL